MSKRIEFDLRVGLSYKPLWKLLVDKDLLKQDLREQARLSSTSIARLNNGENVTTDILLRICQVLDCQIGDIVEVIPASDTKGDQA
ncbi:helix-turn-helix domain-containing protein [Corynebacterium poyangense]|uniref:Helix-turn-helix domain-containing protein n=1 Tax=Corynebacterium poyangense TaxID=2684405 RepID=A0A7H0SRH9_9CORY|nr:helix-turn-helix domain-containing protein [Corynebacterium poyangense]QNQ91154.1 helix-turn-helix domain-containing protein [Corynebacterium poyangense]